jgi:hypothetical protein
MISKCRIVEVEVEVVVANKKNKQTRKLPQNEAEFQEGFIVMKQMLEKFLDAPYTIEEYRVFMDKQLEIEGNKPKEETVKKFKKVRLTKEFKNEVIILRKEIKETLKLK